MKLINITEKKMLSNAKDKLVVKLNKVGEQREQMISKLKLINIEIKEIENKLGMTPSRMTKKEIEQELGYTIKIVRNKK
tara:strand:- start:679 stop:915 length:237 start_codon:yes stop_codon:yes gene_type:complete